MEWCSTEELIAQYKNARSRCLQSARSARERGRAQDAQVYRAMARDLKWTITLMERGSSTPEHRIAFVGGSGELERLAAHFVKQAWDAGEDEDVGGKVPSSIPRVNVGSLLSKREYVCLLAYEKGYTQSAIAGHLGITRGAVATLIVRARKKLSELVSVQMELNLEEADD